MSRRFNRNIKGIRREIAGRTMIVPVRGRGGELDSIYTLNEVGGMIWQLLNGQATVSQTVEAISTAYNVTPEEAARDAAEFICTLDAAGLVQPTTEA